MVEAPSQVFAAIMAAQGSLGAGVLPEGVAEAIPLVTVMVPPWNACV